MKGQFMAEPTSSAVASVAGWKLIGGLAAVGAIGAGLASLVVMCMSHPKDPREWRIALICTVISSICGGSGAVRYLEIQGWIYDPFGVVALVGVLFACGLPGWALIRALFVYLNKKQAAGADLMDYVNDVKELKP